MSSCPTHSCWVIGGSNNSAHRSKTSDRCLKAEQIIYWYKFSNVTFYSQNATKEVKPATPSLVCIFPSQLFSPFFSTSKNSAGSARSGLMVLEWRSKHYTQPFYLQKLSVHAWLKKMHSALGMASNCSSLQAQRGCPQPHAAWPWKERQQPWSWNCCCFHACSKDPAPEVSW